MRLVLIIAAMAIVAGCGIGPRNVTTTYIDTPDGGHVVCAGGDSGGISCDWVHVIPKGVPVTTTSEPAP